MNRPRHSEPERVLGDYVRASRRHRDDPEHAVDVTDPASVEYLDCGSPALLPCLVRWCLALEAWRVKRVTRIALERDLASYRTSAEVHELGAIIARYDDDDVAEIKRILQGRRHQATG